MICVDLKMVNFLLGHQSGYAKYPCFLCLWDSRDKTHLWVRKDWLQRENMDVGEKNVINDALVERENHTSSVTYKVGPNEAICKGS